MSTISPIGGRYDKADERPRFPGAAITQYAGVYVSGAKQVKMPTSDVPVVCYGIAIEAATAASTTHAIPVVLRGQVTAIAGEALSIGNLLTLKGSSGRFWIAKDGDPIAGICLQAASAAGYLFSMELLALGKESSDVKYVAAASITDDTSFTLDNAAGTYIIDYVYIVADGVVTGGLKLGTNSGGAEIFTGWATANGTKVYRPSSCADAVTAAADAFTLTADDTLYLADVTAWNSVTISAFVIKFIKIA